MRPHFLINISSDTENLFGVRFFSSFFANSVSCDVTLFHICRLDCNDTSAPLMEMWMDPEDKVNSGLTVGAKRALDKAKRDLQSETVEIHQMKTKTVQERYGKVKDILAEGKNGLYDAMILGRRATYALQWVFDRPAEEIPQALAGDTSLECPLWICCAPEAGRKNVLLCVDGSESALRAADHVGFILSKVKDHHVTVFHVTTTRTSNITAILEEAIEVLRSHNIEEERIQSKRGWGLSVPGAILSEKRSGSYAAVAIGLHHNPGGMLASFGFQSGTTATLIKKIEKAALWCCP